jgi:hypothetical protein
MGAVLEFLHLVRGHENLLLLQRALQFGPQVRPPGPIKRIGHDFDDDEFIVFDLTRLRRAPSALRRRSGKSGETAELLGKHGAKLAEFSLKCCVPGRQENLDDMHAKPTQSTLARSRFDDA